MRCVRHLASFTASSARECMVWCILRVMVLRRVDRTTLSPLMQRENGYQRRQCVLRKFWTKWTDGVQDWLCSYWISVAKGRFRCFHGILASATEIFIWCSSGVYFSKAYKLTDEETTEQESLSCCCVRNMAVEHEIQRFVLHVRVMICQSLVPTLQQIEHYFSRYEVTCILTFFLMNWLIPGT